MIIELKKVIDILNEYENELFNANIRLVTQKDSASADTREKRDRLRTITAAQVTAVREIRDRLNVPEIKA